MYERNESRKLRWGFEEQGGNKITYDMIDNSEHSDICNKTGENQSIQTPGYMGVSSG